MKTTYADGTPVTVGDSVHYKDANSFVGGGSYNKDGIGTVEEINGGFVHVRITKWNHFESISRLGASEPAKVVMVQSTCDWERTRNSIASKLTRLQS